MGLTFEEAPAKKDNSLMIPLDEGKKGKIDEEPYRQPSQSARQILPALEHQVSM